jgi:hypothetical protein
MTIALNTFVNCDILGLEKLSRTCFWHAFSKACQYATIDKKVYKDLTYDRLIKVRKNVKLWPKKLKKG